MKSSILAILLAGIAVAVPALAQTTGLALPTAVEKQLEAKASNVTEVTLDKSMLGFASKFLDKKDSDQSNAKQLINGLDAIYVRDYEFDKVGQYSPDDLDNLRKQFAGTEWVSMVHTLEKKSGESTDVMAKMVNGESRGMFILSAEPKELTIVLILGPIKMDQLGELGGIGGLGALGNIGNVVSKGDKASTKSGDANATKAATKGGGE
ncbi:MAG: DUF4252 domain-containing protein [Terracidiphilus sp.]|jgi:hypothetical protein